MYAVLLERPNPLGIQALASGHSGPLGPAAGEHPLKKDAQLGIEEFGLFQVDDMAGLGHHP